MHFFSPHWHKVLIVCPYGSHFAQQKVFVCRGEMGCQGCLKTDVFIIGPNEAALLSLSTSPVLQEQRKQLVCSKSQLSITHVNVSCVQHRKENLVWSLLRPQIIFDNC